MSGPDPGGGILLKKFSFGVAVTVIGGLILLLLQPIFAPDHPGTPSAPGESPPTISPSVPTSPPTGISDAPGATAPASPTLTPVPRPPAGTALPYYANWSTGLGGWTGTDDWNAVDGKLLSRGTGFDNQVSITAPVLLDRVQDYAVEAQIQLVRNSNAGAISGVASFGVVVRADSNGGGYGAGRCTSAGIFSCGGPDSSVAVLWTAGNGMVLDATAFKPGEEVHRYRLEVRGNQLTVLVDGAVILTATDNTYLTGKRVGLWSDQAQISVLSFEVTPL